MIQKKRIELVTRPGSPQKKARKRESTESSDYSMSSEESDNSVEDAGSDYEEEKQPKRRKTPQSKGTFLLLVIWTIWY